MPYCTFLNLVFFEMFFLRKKSEKNRHAETGFTRRAGRIRDFAQAIAHQAKAASAAREQPVRAG